MELLSVVVPLKDERDNVRRLVARLRECLDDGPRVLDCIEFDDFYATIPPLYDLAFLLMDLEQRAGRRRRVLGKAPHDRLDVPAGLNRGGKKGTRQPVRHWQ